jgi:hypothetical protein
MRRLRPGSEAEMVALFLRTELPMYFHDNSLPVAGYPGQSPGVPGRCLARGGWRAPAYATQRCLASAVAGALPASCSGRVARRAGHHRPRTPAR